MNIYLALFKGVALFDDFVSVQSPELIQVFLLRVIEKDIDSGCDIE